MWLSINKVSVWIQNHSCYGKKSAFTDIQQKNEIIKIQLKDLMQNLKKMHLAVTEELILPQPNEIKTLMDKMDRLLKIIESK